MKTTQPAYVTRDGATWSVTYTVNGNLVTRRGFASEWRARTFARLAGVVL